MQKENNQLKSSLNPLKDKYRDLETDYNNTLRRLEEKDNQIKYIEDVKRNIQKELDDQKTRNDLLNSEHEKLLNDFENLMKTTTTHEQQLKDLKQQRDDYQ